MIRPKNKKEDLLITITKYEKRLINKLIGTQRNYQKLGLRRQEKQFFFQSNNLNGKILDDRN